MTKPDDEKGDALPLATRMMSAADMYSALVSERVYKNGPMKRLLKRLFAIRGFA
jgi:response regulator RpfG family c-di-GMP phosphodiesterase